MSVPRINGDEWWRQFFFEVSLDKMCPPKFLNVPEKYACIFRLGTTGDVKRSKYFLKRSSTLFFFYVYANVTRSTN